MSEYNTCSTHVEHYRKSTVPSVIRLQGETEVLGQIPVTVPLRSPQIPIGNEMPECLNKTTVQSMWNIIGHQQSHQ